MTVSRRNMIGGIAAAPALAVGGCGVSEDEIVRLRFKVTARARLQGDVYEGFAVNELVARHTPTSLSGFQMARTLRVEATIVDFRGKADALFFLITDYLVVIGLLWGVPVAGDANETTIARLKAIDGRRDYPVQSGGRTLEQSFPRIAAFRDEADPTSVYEVDPEDLAKTHGADARFEGLFIEIVDPETPLTNKIEQRLSWLDLRSGQTIDPLPTGGLRSGSTTFGQTVGHGAFKSES